MGFIVMLAVSVVAYRRATMAGRSAAFWVAMVWVIGLAVGLLVAAAGTVIDILTAPSGTTSFPEPFASFWGLAIGNALGSALVAWRAGCPSVPLAQSAGFKSIVIAMFIVEGASMPYIAVLWVFAICTPEVLLKPSSVTALLWSELLYPVIWLGALAAAWRQLEDQQSWLPLVYAVVPGVVFVIHVIAFLNSGVLA